MRKFLGRREPWECNPVPTSISPLSDGQQTAEKGIPAPQREQSSIKLRFSRAWTRVISIGFEPCVYFLTMTLGKLFSLSDN